MRRTFLVMCVCAASLFTIGQAAWTADTKMDLAPKLQRTLIDFAKKNSLNDAQLAALLGSVVLDAENFRKGGVGVLDNNVFVLLDEPRNSLSVSGKKWKGESAARPQMAVVDEDGTVRAIQVQSGKNLKIVIFSPSDVRFIDLSRNTGGRYLRKQ